MSGRYPDAAADLRAARRALGQSTDAQFAMTVLYTDALIGARPGDLGAARRLAADGLAADDSPMFARYIWPLLWLAARIEADEATLARDRREEVPASTAERCRELAAFAAGLAAQPPVAWLPGAGHRGTRPRGGRGRRRRPGRRPRRRGSWRASPIRWRTPCCAWPRPPAAAGDRQAAARSVRRAHALASQVGAIPIADEATALARRARLSLAGASRTGGHPAGPRIRWPASGSPSASARSWRCSPPAGPTPRSRSPCSSARKRPACTCPTSWPSSAWTAASRPPPWRTASA